jgi:hypothetical protein
MTRTSTSLTAGSQADSSAAHAFAQQVFGLARVVLLATIEEGHVALRSS